MMTNKLSTQKVQAVRPLTKRHARVASVVFACICIGLVAHAIWEIIKAWPQRHESIANGTITSVEHNRFRGGGYYLSFRFADAQGREHAIEPRSASYASGLSNYRANDRVRVAYVMRDPQQARVLQPWIDALSTLPIWLFAIITALFSWGIWPRAKKTANPFS
ncbi:MAG: DUF3592 domain-containing protein [Casimicrobium sp.]